MYEQAVSMLKEKVSMDVFNGQRVPEPTREYGERVIMVDHHGAEKLMLIEIDDTGIWPFNKKYAVCEFKRWAEDADDEKVLRSRGALQIGGIDKVAIAAIKGVP